MSWLVRSLVGVFRLVLALAFTLVVVSVLLSAVVAVTPIHVYADHETGDRRLTVTATRPLGEPYGAVAIHNGAAASSILLEADQWRAFTGLLEKAVGEPSTDWRVIGQVHDTDTAPTTYLAVAAGPGVSLTMREGAVCVAFQLSPAEAARFLRGAQRTGRFLAGDKSDLGLLTYRPGFDSTVGGLLDAARGWMSIRQRPPPAPAVACEGAALRG